MGIDAGGPPPPPPPPPGGPGKPDGPPVGESSSPHTEGHARKQSHQQTRTYPCTDCGGELQFNIGQQSLACPHCGNRQELREATGLVHENDLRRALQSASRGTSTEVNALVAGAKEIICQNCGGSTTFTGTLTASKCPYCATPIQRDDVHAAPDRLAVDGVLPFKVDQKTAKKSVEDWAGSRWFAPSGFKDTSQAGSFASVYTAYFTYDSRTSTDYDGERGEHYTVTVGTGEEQRTETRTRWESVWGEVRIDFDDVPILANTGGGLKVEYIHQLEPWPLEGVSPFSQEYLAGHFARTYDRQVDECWGDAKSHMESVIQTRVLQDIGGDEQRVHNTRTTWNGMTYKHLLLPIWLLTVVFQGQTYQVMVNGATGQVVGERPYSKLKIALTVLGVIAVIALLILLFGR